MPAARAWSTVEMPPTRAWSALETHLQLPPLAILARQKLVGLGRVRELHRVRVVVQLAPLPRPQSGDPQHHRLVQLSAILEWRARCRFTLARAHPVHLVPVGNALD